MLTAVNNWFDDIKRQHQSRSTSPYRSPVRNRIKCRTFDSDRREAVESL
jgi:hypothetical protein